MFRMSLPKMAAELIRHVSADERSADKSPTERRAASGSGSTPEARRNNGFVAEPAVAGA